MHSQNSLSGRKESVFLGPFISFCKTLLLTVTTVKFTFMILVTFGTSSHMLLFFSIWTKLQTESQMSRSATVAGF